MVKRTLSLLIILTLLLGTFTMSFAETDKQRQDRINNHLLSLGIMSGYGDGTLQLEKPISREEFSYLFTNIINDDKANLEKFKDLNYFSDVEKDGWAANHINYLYDRGVIRGYKDDTFKPKNQIKYNEVIKMIIEGLDLEVEQGETWADGYIKRAQEIGILNEIKISNYNEISDRQTVFEMIYNLLEINK